MYTNSLFRGAICFNKGVLVSGYLLKVSFSKLNSLMTIPNPSIGLVYLQYTRYINYYILCFVFMGTALCDVELKFGA